MRVEEERRAIRMVGREEDAPRIVEQEERLEPDHPLHGVNEALVAIAHRHHAAARVAFDVHDHGLLRARASRDGELAHRVARCGAGLAEQHLAHVDRDIRMLGRELAEPRGARGELLLALRAVAQELRMRHVDAQALRRADRVERRLDIPGNAEIAAVDVQRMHDAELFERARERQDDLARRDVVVDVLLVEIELALIELEGADAAGVHHLHGDRLRCVHGPRDIVLDRREVLLRRELAQEIVVGAQHDERAFVDHWRVAHLHMRLARIGGQHGGLEAGRVAHLRVAVTGDMRRRNRAARARARELGARDRIAAMVLRQQRAGDGHLAAADMRVRVDGASHHDLARDVVGLVGARIGPRRYDLAVLDIDVAHGPAHIVGGVINPAAGQLDQHGVGASVWNAAVMAARSWPAGRRGNKAWERRHDNSLFAGFNRLL